MVEWADGMVLPCAHCNRECIIQMGKPIDTITRKLHTCEQYLEKVKTGLIIPKRPTGLQRLMRERHMFSTQRMCQWCGAKWVYNEAFNANDRLYHCPQCETFRGDPVPEDQYTHPKYGNAALVKWAKENGKIIPEHLRKYL